MKKYKALIFDWDGTLMDSAHHIVQSMRQAAIDLKMPVPEAEAVRDIIGLGFKEAADRLFKGLTASDIDTLKSQYGHYFLLNQARDSTFYKGAIELLEALKAEGYLLCVATGKSRRGLDRTLDTFGVKHLFVSTRTADETLSKPHPLMLEEILEELQISAEDALMIGDTEYDLEMANAANMDAVGLTCGVHDHARLQACKPVVILSDVTALKDWLPSNQ